MHTRYVSMFVGRVRHVMAKVTVHDDWLDFDEKQDLEYDADLGQSEWQDDEEQKEEADVFDKVVTVVAAEVHLLKMEFEEEEQALMIEQHWEDVLIEQ